MNELIPMLEKFGSPRVVLVGDFMLDRYVYGDAERISPEAPVPVLRTMRCESRTGGAGSVAAAVLAMGGQVSCVGVIGQDPAGDELKNILMAGGAETADLVRLPGFATTVKTRYVGLAQHRHAQQILRVDQETPEAVSEPSRLTIRAAARSAMSRGQIVAIEDYDKGVLTDASCAEIIADARKAHLPVVIDPARRSDYRRYRGATVLTPNRYEAETASGVTIRDEASLRRAAEQVLLSAEAEAVVITLDREGAYILDRTGAARRVPTRPRAVYDVTGAGDEVLAMLAVAMASGCDLDKATALANVAGGLEVERFGVVPITRQEVLDELRRMVGLRGGKVLDRGRLCAELARRRSNNETVVFTNGVFDLLHIGHLRYLQQARELGSCLVVAINSDASARRNKGEGRPVIGQDERAAVLAALECVDYVTVFDEDTPVKLLEAVRPDVLAKGGATQVVVGRELVEGYGGKVRTLEEVAGMSTTQIINRILGSTPKDSD